MNFIKKYLFPFLICGCLFVVLLNSNKIITYLSEVLDHNPDIVILPKNDYTKDYDFAFVQESKDYIPYSYQDLINIFYSTINNGWTSFTFYCPIEYEDCVSDVKKISTDEVLLSHINNFVHPYNSFTTIKTSYDESGEVTISLEHLYTDEMIKLINNKIDALSLELITSNMTNEEKIKAFHDYIINNSKYDVERNSTGNSTYLSTTAYGSLIEHYAICGGYSDAMAIILDKLGIHNYKIASHYENDDQKGHVWNAVNLNNTWYHLDLTWDDPVTDNGTDYLDHSYMLINTDKLKVLDLTVHDFDPSIYIEFNN